MFSSKKERPLRICNDWRKNNSVTIKDSYQIPGMDDCLTLLGAASIFLTIDANSGSWQIESDEWDKYKTMVTLNHRRCRFSRMRFGMKSVSSTLQPTMEVIPSMVKWKVGLVYFDYFVLLSTPVQEHLHANSSVVEQLFWACMSLNMKKPFSFERCIDYLVMSYSLADFAYWRNRRRRFGTYKTFECDLNYAVS